MGEARRTELTEKPKISSSFSIANINPGTVRAEFMRSIMALVNLERTFQHTIDPLTPRVQFDQFLDKFSGPYLDDERNRCVEWFLGQTTSDRLLFVDSDIAFDPQQAFDLIQLAEDHSLALLGGVYYNAWSSFPGDKPGEGIGPVAYRWMDSEGEDDPPFLEKITAKEILNYDSDIMEVDAMGTGFMSIHRDLLTLVGETYGGPCPWFAEPILHGVHIGEDMAFCHRSVTVGHQPHIAPKITVDHYKMSRIRIQPEPTESSES